VAEEPGMIHYCQKDPIATGAFMIFDPETCCGEIANWDVGHDCWLCTKHYDEWMGKFEEGEVHG
jgi:hypothetical protein